ncbi:MAG: hypothetical protein SCH98_17225 [Deferrisomatales bacterium]|nr:hypothetical protein [Deferrisomatales bacterium]
MSRRGDLGRDELLRALTEAAAQAVRAERVVVFGPWARGSESPGDPVDLLVVTAAPFGGGQDRTRMAAQLGSALANFRIPKRILVFTAAEVARWGGSAAHPTGRIMGESSRSGPDPEGAHLLLDVAAKHLKAVHGMADSDLFDDDIFGFHCHAAAASALRAWLALLGADPWLAADDLGELLTEVGERTDLPERFADLTTLSIFAVQHFLVPADDLLAPGGRRRLQDLVRRLHEHVQGLLEERSPTKSKLEGRRPISPG